MLIGGCLSPLASRRVGLLASWQSPDGVTLGVGQTTRVVGLRSKSGGALGKVKSWVCDIAQMGLCAVSGDSVRWPCHYKKIFCLYNCPYITIFTNKKRKIDTRNWPDTLIAATSML